MSLASVFASRPALAVYVALALGAVPYALPASTPIVPWPGGAIRAERLRLLSPRPDDAAPRAVVNAPVASVGEVSLVAPTDDRGDEDPGATARHAAGPIAAKDAPADDPPRTDAPPLPIVDPSGHALDAFYAALARTEAKEKGGVTKIVYYGDSVVAADWVTSTLRRKLQGRFGDAGHGYVLPVNAWPGYFHADVARFASKGWKASRVVGPYAEDGVYGLGGVSLVAEGPGTFATIATAKPGSAVGERVARFDVAYVVAPGGGDLGLALDGGKAEITSTAADEKRIVHRAIEVPDGPHQLEVRSFGHGPVRVLGVELERDEPGVVVDALGIVGCRLRFLDKFDDAIWREELARENPALITFAYGANESEDGFAYPMDQYEQTARAVLAQAKKDLPNASCLIVGPMDRADKKDGGYVTRDVVPAMNEIQKRLAAELGCAFFDTFHAMGGYGSMGVWVQRGLGGADLVHPTSTGADVIGTWLYRALMTPYEQRKR